MALNDRLRLSKDLAMAGLPGLDASRPDAAAIQGIVQSDLAFDIAARAALEVLGRGIPIGDFPILLDALPELGAHRHAIADLHRMRNHAQHGGLPPPASARPQLRSDAVRGLELVFQMAGHDFHRFSSVPQLASPFFRELLETALCTAPISPSDAVALVMIVFRRLRGWAEQMLGEAAIPDSMWLHASERWNDVRMMVRCADNQDEVVDAMRRVAATTVLKLDVPSWTRLLAFGEGRNARWHNGAWRFEHAPTARPISEVDALWAVEAVARAALSLELEWPEFVLIRDQAAAAQEREG